MYIYFSRGGGVVRQLYWKRNTIIVTKSTNANMMYSNMFSD